MTLIAVGRGAQAAPRRLRLHRANFAVGILAGAGVAGIFGFVGFGAEGIWKLHMSTAPLRSAIETGVTLSALASAVLLLAHFQRTRLLRDLLLLAALATVALTDFVFNALPAYGYQTGIYGGGARIALTILIAGTFVAVAFVPAGRRVETGRRLAAVAVPLAIYFVAVGELVDLIAGPVPVHGSRGIYGAVVITLAVLSSALLLASGYGFTIRRRCGDREGGLLAGAALLMVGAHLQKLVLPVVPADWVTPADALRLGACGLLLAVSVRLYRRSHDQLARDAVSAERLRIARDLHDGLAQDLAFIAAHSGRLAREYGADHPLALAAQRALAASRGQIVDLEASSAPNTEAALREVAADMAFRLGVEVDVNVENFGDPDRSESERHELVRIAREAIANAVRHGGARHVWVTLGSRRDDLLLRISDDGCGFAAASGDTAGTGLGLRTMRDRARHIGAQLVAGHGERGGTDVDVVALPTRVHSEV
jgi:signal transduction histidine kinase